MKISIIFHSVCGNCYLIAKTFKEVLQKTNNEVSMHKVEDMDWALQKDTPKNSEKLLKEMNAMPSASPEDLLNSDLIIMGCPTYFGNVSAEMKAFMDTTSCYWIDAKLAGKKLAAFTSASNEEGGGDLCLSAIHTYAKYMGMLTVPIPTSLLPKESIPAFGLIHYSFAKYADVLDEKTQRIIENFSEVLLNLV